MSICQNNLQSILHDTEYLRLFSVCYNFLKMSKRTCCVNGCNSRPENGADNITFHFFPKDETLYEAWIAATGKQNWTPNTYSRICSKHFEKDCFRKTKRMGLLKPGSVPNIFVHNLQASSDPLKAFNPTYEVKLESDMNCQLSKFEESTSDDCFNTDQMSAVCRACLATNVRMYSLQKHRLAQYIQLTGLNIGDDDKFPRALCWECAHRLAACHRFRARARLAHCLLEDLWETTAIITKETVKKINRYKNGLQSKLVHYNITPDYHDLKVIETYDDVNQDGDETIRVEENKREIKVEKFKQERNVFTEVIKEELETEDYVETEYIDIDPIEDSFPTLIIDENDVNRPARKRKLKEVKERKRKKVTVKEKRGVKKRSRKDDNVENSSEEHDDLYSPKSKFMHKIDENIFEIKNLSFEEQLQEVEKRKESENYKNANFRCEKCFKGFLDDAAYKYHMILHTSKSGPLECEVCRIRCGSRHRYKRHLLIHRQKFNCRLCPFVCSVRGHAKSHQDFHQGIMYQCPHCDQKMSKPTTLLSHIRLKHPSAYACALCGTSFVSEKGLDMHTRRKHRFDDHVIPKGNLPCHECELRFASEEALSTHMKEQHKVRSERPKFLTSSLGKERAAPGGARKLSAAPVHCEQCPEVLPTALAYYHHFKSEHPGLNRTQFPSVPPRSRYMCEACGKICTSAGALEEHQAARHGARARRFPCPHCDKSFARRPNLQVHVSSVHSGLRYECKVCGRSFTKKGNRQRHMVGHTGLTPFECGVCGKRFAHRHNLRTHHTYVHLKKAWPARARARNPKVLDTKEVIADEA